MVPTYTVYEIREAIHEYNHRELIVLNWIVNEEQESYTDDELIDLHDMIVRQVLFLRNPWWFRQG